MSAPSRKFRRSDVRKLSSENIHGKTLCLSIINHDSSHLCFEFTVEPQADSFSKIEFVFYIGFILGLIGLLFIDKESSLGFVFISSSGYRSSLYLHCVLASVVALRISKLLFEVRSESLLLVAPLGLQITATFGSGYQTSQFIPWYSVADIIINEAITLHRVIYYLAVIVNEFEDGVTKKKLIPLYKHTRPRLVLLQPIYENIQKLRLLHARTKL